MGPCSEAGASVLLDAVIGFFVRLFRNEDESIAVNLDLVYRLSL